MGQDDDPFAERGSDTKPQESEYDFADVHQWDDVMVKLINTKAGTSINWTSTNAASHRGVAGKSQNFSFSIDFKSYEDSLQHPDLNRGVILMAGDLRFPLLHCWLRPFSVREGKANFQVSVPRDRLKEMHIAFIPREGKVRYLCNLNEVALGLEAMPKPQEK